MGAGGVTRVFLNVAKELENAGYDVKVVAPYRAGIAGIGIPSQYIVGYVWRYKLRVQWLRRILRIFHWVTNWWFYFLFARKYRHDVFVVFAGNMWPEWCHYSSCPRILWLHGTDAIRKNTVLTKFLVQKIRTLTEQVDRVVSVSKFTQAYWERTFSPKSWTNSVIYNYLDVDAIRIKAEEEVAHLKDKAVPNIVYVGRISEEKGVDRLLAVATKLKNEGYKFTLTIVGPGSISDATVEYVGEKKNPYPYIRRADLLVLPSRYEGASLVVCEALALHTPVISTDCGGPREILNNGAMGCLVENSEQGIYEGLKDYLNHPSSFIPSCGWDEAERILRDRNNRARQDIVSLFRAVEASC